MHTLLHQPLQIDSLCLPNRLIQGPLAGYSCAPFRELFTHFVPPAYCVSEMISAQDVLDKHTPSSRYLHRSPHEGLLAYQLSGTVPAVLAKAALKLQDLGADLIDLNCGCPKAKIRKKGAGSALLESPEHLIELVKAIKKELSIPLTVKIRLQSEPQDLLLAQQIEDAGADALIVHGRRWVDEYEVPVNLQAIAAIKQKLSIPVIANGDIHTMESLHHTLESTQCDGFMISRAGTGKPWLYEELLTGQLLGLSIQERVMLFMTHLEGLAKLENEYKAVLQSRSLLRYYFRQELPSTASFYSLTSLNAIHVFLQQLLIDSSAAIHL